MHILNIFKLGFDDVLGIIENGLRSICGWLCEIIYPLIASSYKLFIDLGTLVYSDEFSGIYDKISLIIGIFMVFRVTFWLIEMMVNPDGITDKEKNPGKIVQKVLFAVVLLAVTPRIFEMAFRIQTEIIKSHTIEKIISPNNIDENEDLIGKEIAANLFDNFYTLADDDVLSTGEKKSEIDNCSSHIEDPYEGLYNEGKLNITNYCLTARVKEDTTSDYIINFNGLVAVIIGAVVLWMILLYCIDVGARYAQLIFLQVIAPIPIMCYLTPKKDNMFSRWVQQCTTTYLDLFIRVAIISFVLLLTNMLLSNDNNILVEIGANNGWIVKVFLVLGLLIFAKKAPALIQEILPKSATKASGDFGLSFKKRAENMAFGKHIAKGYDKTVGFLGNTAKSAALMPLTLGKKTITGIDSASHGKGFWNGFNKNPGKTMQWINKQRESLTPEAYKASKERVEGRENVNAIRVKWNDGAKVAEKLINAGVRDWQGALDGKTQKNYKTIFKHDKFINSKMAVDRASKNEETYRLAQQEISMASASGKKLGIRTLNLIGENGITIQKRYDLDSEEGRLDFSKDYDKQQKILKGAEDVHTEISKQYQDDAATEKQFKFIKNNEVNPANQSEDHTSRGIGKSNQSNSTSEEPDEKEDAPENNEPIDDEEYLINIHDNGQYSEKQEQLNNEEQPDNTGTSDNGENE